MGPSRATIPCMGLTDDLARRVERKRQEIAVLEQQLMAAKAYLQAMDEALKLAERSSSPSAMKDVSRGLRKGSMPAKAFPVLKRAGRTMYLTALLEGMGVPVTAKNKRSLASALSAYARKGEIFTRPEPNTFGLVEFEQRGGGEDADLLDEPDSVQAHLKLAR